MSELFTNGAKNNTSKENKKGKSKEKLDDKLVKMIVEVTNLPRPGRFLCNDREYLTRKELMKSYLYFTRTKPASTWSSMYKKKFYGLILYEVLTHLSAIIEGQMRAIPNVKRKGVKELLSLNLSEFRATMVGGSLNDYSDSLMRIYEILMLRSDIKGWRSRKRVNEYVQETYPLLKGVGLEDMLLLNELMKFAYVLCTNDIDHIPAVLVNIDYGIYDDEVKESIRHLGELIIDDWNKNGMPLFVCVFMETCPTFTFRAKRFRGGRETLYGYRALAMVDFMLHDKSIHKIITTALYK